MPTAKGIKSIARLTKIGEPRSEKKIRGVMRWTHITGTIRNGVEDMISYLVWFGIIILISAIMFVLYAVVSYDERKKKQERKEKSEDDTKH